MLERAKGFEPSTPTLARLCCDPLTEGARSRECNDESCPLLAPAGLEWCRRPDLNRGPTDSEAVAVRSVASAGEVLQKVAHTSMSRRRFAIMSQRQYAASTLSESARASARFATSRGCAVALAHHSQKQDRKLCIVGPPRPIRRHLRITTLRNAGSAKVGPKGGGSPATG